MKKIAETQPPQKNTSLWLAIATLILASLAMNPYLYIIALVFPLLIFLIFTLRRYAKREGRLQGHAEGFLAGMEQARKNALAK